MGIPQSNTNSDIGSDEEAQLQDVDERSNKIKSAASSNYEKKDNSRPSPLLKDLLKNKPNNSKKTDEDKFMSPNPKQRKGVENPLEPILSQQKSPLEKSISMFEILSQNRLNANQLQSHMQYSQKKNQSPRQIENVVSMPSEKLYKTKQKEVRVQKRIFIEFDPPKLEQLQPQVISQQQQNDVQIISEPYEVKSKEVIQKPQEENKTEEAMMKISQAKDQPAEVLNDSQKKLFDPANSSQIKKEIDLPLSQLVLSDSKASVSQNNQEEPNNQIASPKIQQLPKQPYALRQQNNQLHFNFEQPSQIKSQPDSQNTEENKEQMAIVSPLKLITQSQQVGNQYSTNNLGSTKQQKLLIEVQEPNRIASDYLKKLVDQNQEAEILQSDQKQQDSAQIELLANIMKNTIPVESDQSLQLKQLPAQNANEESKDESLLAKFGGETKLLAFIEKLVDSLAKDSTFTQSHENFKKSNSLQTYFRQEDALLNLARALFECESLSQVSEIKKIINKFCLSDDLFECFYKDHFSKHLKTMKVNIKIVQQVLKKMNSMRDDIVCLNQQDSNEKSAEQQQEKPAIKIPERVKSTKIIVHSEVQDEAMIKKCTMIMTVQQEPIQPNVQAAIEQKNQQVEEPLFEKFGGEEKCRQFVDKLQSAVISTTELCPYHKKQANDPTQDEMLKEKMVQYFKYLLGGSKFWLGRSMKEAHQHLKISEEHFDLFYKHFTTQLKTMKVPIKIMQTLIKKVNELRSEVIYNEQETTTQEQNQSVCLLKVLGEEAGIQKILALTFQMIKNESPLLLNCFVEKSTNMFVQKYSLFILANIDEKYHWMAKDMIDGIRNTGISQERYIEILQYIKIACQQLQILEQASDMLINNLYELREDICSQIQRTGSILDQLDNSQKFEKLIEQFFISLSRSVELKIQGAYQKLEERTPLIQRISKIIVSKSDDELDIDIEVYQNLSINSNLPIYIAGDCFRDTLMDCGVDKDSADLARKAFISLRENKQEEVHNRMVRIASSIDFPTNELESSFTQQKSKFYQIRQQLRSQSLGFIPPMEALSSRTNSSIIEQRHLLSSSSSGGIILKQSPRQNETPDEAIEEVKEDITQQSQLEQENSSQEQDQNQIVIEDILRSNSPVPSMNCQLQFDSENNVEESKSSQKKAKEKIIQQKFQLIELLPAKSVPSRSDHKLIQFHLEDFRENQSLVPKEPKRTSLLYECEINQMSPKYRTLCKVFLQLNNKALLVYRNIKSYIQQPSKPLFIVPTSQIRKVKTYYIEQLSLILPNEQSEASEINDEQTLRRSQPVWGLKISLKMTYNNIVKQITDYEESPPTPINRKNNSKNKQLKPSQGSQTNMQEQGDVKHLIFIDEESQRVQKIAQKTKKLIIE